MDDPSKHIKPDRNRFGIDPFGYSALARDQWGMANELAGFPTDISKPATSAELKNPILWLAQAHALGQAAIAVLSKEQDFEVMPFAIRGSCDSQYCAAGLMLVGYSLEICLKAMIITRDGVEAYTNAAKDHAHHRLHDLAAFIPELSKKDIAILRGLSFFVTWAGRYPDPGEKRIKQAEEIHRLSQKHQISAGDVFALANKVMGYAKVVIDEKHPN